MKPDKDLKVALVYDRVNKWGGAERLLLALHHVFPNAPLYTSVYNPVTAPWARVFDIRTSFLQRVLFLRSHHEFVPYLMPLAFESFDFSDFDLVVSVTSAEAKGVITRPETLHICYCLTPTRYLWIMDPLTSYHSFGILDPLATLIKTPILNLLKKWDEVAKYRPDAYISISKLVRERVKKFYGYDSSVVYPPLDENIISNASSVDDYFLIVTRLVPYKRIDLAINTFNRYKLQLKVVGSGSDFGRLKNLAGDTVELLGFQPESRLPDLYAHAKAVIIPGEEEFCLTALEAQANGKPVIAYRYSGVADIVFDGKTGILFSDQTEKSLGQALTRFSTMKINPDDCRTNAKRFSFANFKKDFLHEVNLLLDEHQKRLSI